MQPCKEASLAARIVDRRIGRPGISRRRQRAAARRQAGTERWLRSCSRLSPIPRAALVGMLLAGLLAAPWPAAAQEPHAGFVGAAAQGQLAGFVGAPAQGQLAGFVGTVTSPAGTPQPRLVVLVTNLDTGLERRAVTDDSGRFTIGGLPPGNYEIRVEEEGWAATRLTDLVLEAGEREQVNVVLQPAEPDFVPTPDRWRLDLPVWQRYPADLPGTYPFVDGSSWDPYNQNTLKGDRPIIGQDVFMNLTATSLTPFEFRIVPTPTGPSTQEPDSDDFFGDNEQFALVQDFILSFELFKGDTAFKPKTWAFRITPVFNINYANTQQTNVVDINPEVGKNRRRDDFALQEAYGEVKLFDVGANYDFVSLRAGIQPFMSDFRGFLFKDQNLGVRLFGNWGRNRNQWNVAFFDQLEKETNSELNLFERRDQRVIIANYYRQDFLTLGYTISPSFHANLDDGEEFFFDANGLLVRPAAVGVVRPHKVHAYYIGFAGDGHLGRLNITHQFYQALGTDEFNGIAAQETEINAQFAAVELSIDRDWSRPRMTLIFASGDDEPGDDQATGFDAIFEDQAIVGGPFSFWNRQGIRLSQTFLELVGRRSVLPAMRSSKTEGQANFVNPGLLLVNVGWDAELTPKLRMATNASYMRFHHTDVLRTLLFQSDIDEEIGYDYSVGFQYRPWLNDNAIVLFGASGFTPGQGFQDILTADTLFSPFVITTFTY